MARTPPKSSQYIKLCTIATSLLIAGGAYTTHSSESFWPAIPIVALVSGLAILSLILYRSTSNPVPVLVMVVSLAVFVRLFPSLSVPTLPGNDPHKYAVAVNSILEHGTTEMITLPFYGAVPTFVTFAAAVSHITGVSAWGGLTVYPLLIGIVLPLLAFVLVRRLEAGTNTMALLAALLAAVAVEGVRYATQPNANMLAVLLFGLLIYSMSRFLESGTKRALIPTICIATALLFTHKLAPILVIGFVIATAVALRVRSMSSDTPVPNRATLSLPLIGLAVIGGLIQWTFITDFIASTVLRLVAFGGGEIATPPPPEAAKSVSDGVLNTVHRRLHILALLPIGGLAWLYAVYSQRDISTVVLLAATAAIGALMPLAILDPTAINPIRVYLSFELLLVVLVCLGLGALLKRGGVARHLAVVLFVGLLTAQAGSAFFVADVPGENREYLTEQEIEGKEFTQATTGDVGSDWFYSDQAANLDQSADERSWQAVHPQLLEGDIEGIETEYVAHRTAEPYRIYQPWSGRWELTYNASDSLDANRHRIYSNRGVTFYARPSSP